MPKKFIYDDLSSRTTNPPNWMAQVRACPGPELLAEVGLAFATGPRTRELGGTMSERPVIVRACAPWFVQVSSLLAQAGWRTLEVAEFETLPRDALQHV